MRRKKEDIKVVCSNCGKELNATSNFCQYCGTKVEIPKESEIEVEKISKNSTKKEALQDSKPEEVSVVYCYNQQCHLGARACLTLAEYGYPVMLLEGGFKTWTEDFRFSVV